LGVFYLKKLKLKEKKMRKFLIVLVMVAMASFLLVGCNTGTTPVTPITTVEPELQLTGITVDPKTMDLVVGETEEIDSVTATYEVKGYDLEIVDLKKCLFLTSDSKVATVSDEGKVTAIKAGTANIIVSYEGKVDTVVVTVKKAVIKIDGFLSPYEWGSATEIPIAGEKGFVKVLATTDYLYVLFKVEDSTDAREGEEITGPDQAGINVNPSDGEAYGLPCDIIFETVVDYLAWTGISSGQTDGWETNWEIDDSQAGIPEDLKTKTIYSGGYRISEWKVPLATISPAVGDVLKVGGVTNIDETSYRYPTGLEWGNASTYEDITVQ